ncbi:MAG: class I SAM-dependent methyltransferase [Balneolales bacterium]|nr:class I SAM-dependent methyltransferase [Balneolales bacterium]
MALKEIDLKTTGDERDSLRVLPEVGQLANPYNGNLTSAAGTEVLIRDNIICYMPKSPAGITLAQRTNFIPATASAYEDIWRKRSIGILSGENFSIEDEERLLLSWIDPRPGEIIADIGCSTALYARAMSRKEPQITPIALDFSLPMLREAREKAAKDGVSVYLLQADAENLPFYANTVDKVVCGGSLNEFANPEKALYEMRRVLKPGGKVFMMHLLRSDHFIGKVAQKTSETGGIHFWTEDESRKLFSKADFLIQRKHSVGIVMFSLLQVEK